MEYIFPNDTEFLELTKNTKIRENYEHSSKITFDVQNDTKKIKIMCP